MTDLISRQAVVDVFDGVKVDEEYCTEYDIGYNDGIDFAVSKISVLPSAEPTLYGYDIKQLELIARILQKENLPPEMVADVLSDIGRIIAIVCDEFAESCRKEIEHGG